MADSRQARPRGPLKMRGPFTAAGTKMPLLADDSSEDTEPCLLHACAGMTKGHGLIKLFPDHIP